MASWRTSLVAALGLAALVATGACQEGAGPAGGTPSLRVLFIGNSLTYTNDLPQTLVAAAGAAGDEIYVETIAKPNYAIIDHLTDQSGTAERIRNGHWDVVVLQQGPTTLAVSRDSLVAWTRVFDTIIRPTGARTALFMVWPSGGTSAGFDAVRVSYQAAATAVQGEFLPAGAAWQIALLDDPSLALYGSDHFHPAPLGSYLAAITIYEAITDRDARSLPGQAVVGSTVLNVPTTMVRLLQNAAHEANVRY